MTFLEACERVDETDASAHVHIPILISPYIKARAILNHPIVNVDIFEYCSEETPAGVSLHRLPFTRRTHKVR